MYSLRALLRRPVAWLSIVMLLCAPGSGLSAWMQAGAKPATAKPVPAKTTAPASPDGAWPRTYLNNAGTLVIYQPQISSWDGQKLLQLHAAVSFKPAGKDKAMLGTVIAEAETRVSIEERLVDFSKFRVTQSNFPNSTKEETAAAVAALSSSIPAQERVIALDRVLASFDSSQIIPKNVTGLKADPPVVFYSTRAAALVNIDGEPVWSPIAENDLRYAVNTNWDLFEHQPTKIFYLRHDKMWLQATAFKGPWTLADQLPPSFSKLPADENWKDVKAALPLKKPAATAMPTVFVSTTPAELILLKGAPAYVGVTGTRLLWISNTESDVFRLGSTGPVYYLVAGRWFSSPGFNGPWTFATTALPEDFRKIPLEHERSRVLASVPGTTQAAEAVLLAQVPNTARVNKKEIKAPEVAYQGEPKFEAIPTTTVARAANTDKDIIKVGDLYYMCYQGVWFMSRSASGPWTVAETVPKEIYQIPVSSPSHNVTYVTIEDDDDDDWVVFAAAAAYTGVMIGWGCAVWGSGYYYPPYVGYGGFYPAYYPHYPTYGYGASYNPWTGAYSRGMVAYGPYGGAGVGARYNPRTGTYSRGAAAYGPYGSRGAASAYNPRTGAVGATRQGSNVYGSWGSTAVQRGDNWAQTSRVTSNVTGNTTRVTQGSGGGAAVSRNPVGPGGATVGRTGSGDVYAGKDGNVYRKGSDGSWQQYGGDGGWSAAQPKDRSSSGANAGTVSDLNRESAARAEGAQRTRDASTAKSGSSSGATSGTYRPSGGTRSSAGGARAGGGGRRR